MKIAICSKNVSFSDNISFQTTEDNPAIEPIDFSFDINPSQDENTQVQFNENLNASEEINISVVSTASELTDNDTSFVIRSRSTSPRNIHEYPLTIATACQFGISTRAVCALGNAILTDLRLNDSSNTLLSGKIQRLMEKYGSELAEEKKQISGYAALMFDGRIDRTLMCSGRKRIQQEHIVIISEPGSQYVDHFSPISGKAHDIARHMILFIRATNSEDTIRTIGADGTAVNTGCKNGVISLIEKDLNRPLQWIICMFHLNELPLRHLFKMLDGSTSGPNTYKGIIGSAIEKDVTKLPLIGFKKIRGRVPVIPQVVDGFRGDQKYFYEICRAVQSGIVSQRLEKMSPGKLCEARWLTKANRILRLYISTLEPTSSLKRLSFIILNFYAPAWYHLKKHYRIEDGLRNFFYIISLASVLRRSEKNIVHKTLLNNFYFAHHENVLLSMLTDDSLDIRNLAIRKILLARRKCKKETTVRQFNRPSKINFNAKHYSDMIDWKSINSILTEPPITKMFSTKQLMDATKNNQQIELGIFKKIPNNTQAVERGVKMVTEASVKVDGYAKRHSYILNQIKARSSI